MVLELFVGVIAVIVIVFYIVLFLQTNDELHETRKLLMKAHEGEVKARTEYDDLVNASRAYLDIIRKEKQVVENDVHLIADGWIEIENSKED